MFRLSPNEAGARISTFLQRFAYPLWAGCQPVAIPADQGSVMLRRHRDHEEITAGQYLQSIRASTLCTTTGFRAFRARFYGVTVEERCVSAVITPEGQLNLFAWFGPAVGDERRSSDWVQPEVDQTGSAAGRTVGEPSRRVATYRSLREVAGKRLGKQ